MSYRIVLPRSANEHSRNRGTLTRRTIGHDSPHVRTLLGGQAKFARRSRGVVRLREVQDDWLGAKVYVALDGRSPALAAAHRGSQETECNRMSRPSRHDARCSRGHEPWSGSVSSTH